MLLVMAPWVIVLVEVTNLYSKRVINYLYCGWERYKAIHLITDHSFGESQLMV